MVKNVKFRIFVIMLNATFNISAGMNISKFHFYCSIYCLIFFMYVLFVYWCTQILIPQSYAYNFFSLKFQEICLQQLTFLRCVLKHFNVVIIQPRLHWSIVKITTPVYPYLALFMPCSFKILWSALVIVIPFLTFNGSTQTYLL